jgi:glucose/arabinose dehydrogenase
MRARTFLLLPVLSAYAGLFGCGSKSSGSAAAGETPAPGFDISVVVGLAGPATDLAFLPDGRMVITSKDGVVWLATPPGTAAEAGRFPVDTESEKGLLGVVVPPSFAEDGRLVFYYSLADSAGGTDLERNRVVSVVLRGDGTLDPASEVVLVSGLRGPANHDGGGMAIGPDDKLYVGVGDTGCGSGARPEPPQDPTNYFATCLSNGNGKILRVNLDGSVPGDNPLAGVAEVTACGASCGDATTGGALAPPRPEIWAWGFRNPWRLAFDAATGLLWVGDVGEVTYEEITIAEAGRHHGWPWREGSHGWSPDRCRAVVPDTGDCVDPVYECRHGAAAGGIDGGCQAIVGGTFLAATRWPEGLRDRYVFADAVNGQVWSLQLTADRRGVVPGSRQLIAAAPGAPASIRPGPDGDLYLALLTGAVARLSPAGEPEP